MYKAKAYNFKNQVVREEEFNTEEKAEEFINNIKKDNNICEWKTEEESLFNKEKVTIYLTGGLGLNIVAYESYLLRSGRMDYAQYKKVPYVVFTPKGKRKPLRHLKGYNPFILVVNGWGLPSCPDGFITKEDNGFICKESKYLSHDERYIIDFNKWFSEQDFKILLDYRYNKEVV